MCSENPKVCLALVLSEISHGLVRAAAAAADHTTIYYRAHWASHLPNWEDQHRLIQSTIACGNLGPGLSSSRVSTQPSPRDTAHGMMIFLGVHSW